VHAIPSGLDGFVSLSRRSRFNSGFFDDWTRPLWRVKLSLIEFWSRSKLDQLVRRTIENWIATRYATYVSVLTIVDVDLKAWCIRFVGA
jgi:hypothetical protein